MTWTVKGKDATPIDPLADVESRFTAKKSPRRDMKGQTMTDTRLTNIGLLRRIQFCGFGFFCPRKLADVKEADKEVRKDLRSLGRQKNRQLSVEPVALPTTGSAAAEAGTGRQWPRLLPGARALRTTLRTAHLVAFGALYGGHLYGVPADRLWPALLATVATGGAFMSLEIYCTPLWLGQLRGVATLVKIALIAAVAIFWDVRVWLLTATIIIAGVASHMPGRYRYYSVLHGRVVGDQDAG